MTTRYDLVEVTVTAGDLVQTGVNAVYAYDLNLVNSLLFDTTNDLIDIDYQDKALTQIVSNLDNAELRFDAKSISLNLNLDGLSLETINQLQSYKRKQNYILLAELVNGKGVVLGLEMDKTKPFLRYKKSRSQVSESGSSGKVSDGGSSPINRTKLKISFGNDDVIFVSTAEFFNIIHLKFISFERAAVADISNVTITGVSQKKTDRILTAFSNISSAVLGIGLKNFMYGNVTAFDVKSAALTTVDLTNNSALRTLNLNENSLSTLDISKNTALLSVNLATNQFDKSLNSTFLTLLDSFGLPEGTFESSIHGGGFITPLGVTSHQALIAKSWTITGVPAALDSGVTYNIEDFPLVWITNLTGSYTANTFVADSAYAMTNHNEYDAITIISISSKSLTTNITDVFLSKFENLTNITCATNSITELDLRLKNDLLIIQCSNNSIDVLDISNLVVLRELFCENNSIIVLDFTLLTAILKISCSNNDIIILNLTNCPLINFISAHNNDIEILNLTYLTLLTYLTCQFNDISVLNTTNTTLLTQLFCNNNSILILDLTNLTLLTRLDCQNNLLTTLDFSNTASLLTIVCHSNQITSSANSQMLVDLDGNGLSNGYINSFIYGGGSLTTAGASAKTALQGKGWTVIGL